MKIRFLKVMAAFFLLYPNHGAAMDVNAIRQLMERMDDSLLQGNTFHMNYVVCTRTTDSYYARRKEFIKMFEDMVSKEQSGTPVGEQTLALTQRWDTCRLAVKQWNKELNSPREQTFYTDYSLGGNGFYFKRSMTYVDVVGKAGFRPADIYVSDGKIMGRFNPTDSQAVIQPTTERPQIGNADWTEFAYLFMRSRISTYISKFPILSIKDEGESFLIAGDDPKAKKEFSHIELNLEKTTLTPRSLVFYYQNAEGKLKQKLVKTWQFQKFEGLLLPCSVIDQEYKSDLEGNLNLEKERTFTISSFDPTPINSKDELAKLLQSDFSVFDEITGNHYLSGSAPNALDKLSK